MLYLLTYTLGLIIVLTPPRRQTQGQLLAALLQRLQGLWAPEDPRCSAAQDVEAAAGVVAQALKRALFEGYDSSAGMAVLQEALSQSQLFHSAHTHFLALMRFRWGVCLLTVQAGRSWLLLQAASSGVPLGGVDPLAAVDVALGAASLVLVGLGCHVLGARAPKDWLWQHGFSKEATQWLELLLGGRPQNENSLTEKIRRLYLLECTSGLDQSSARQLCLTLWEKERRQEQMLYQRKFEDSLPLFELLGLGLPALLLLVVPSLPLIMQL